jgi:release factor glutamine methyltransferase
VSDALAVATTVRSVLARASRDLESATPRLDAELLLAEALGVSRSWLVTERDALVAPEALARFERLLDRRRSHEPVAYILGERAFRYITLNVDRRVLIPRPETELLVEVGLELPRGTRVIDVGTGSGAIALALASERPDLEVWGSDVDAQALGVARANARRLGLDVRFLEADLLAGVPGPFGAVLANLPYVPEGDRLPPDVAQYEPRAALFAGGDGLDVIRRLVRMVGETPCVALEVGLGQAGAVSALLAAAGFPSVESRRDLAGIERVVLARR